MYKVLYNVLGFINYNTNFISCCFLEPKLYSTCSSLPSWWLVVNWESKFLTFLVLLCNVESELQILWPSILDSPYCTNTDYLSGVRVSSVGHGTAIAMFRIAVGGFLLCVHVCVCVHVSVYMCVHVKYCHLLQYPTQQSYVTPYR